MKPSSAVTRLGALLYEGLAGIYAHSVVDHGVKYVNRRVHTIGFENFWSLLKRSIHGTYVSINLSATCTSRAFRYNDRKTMDDNGRFKSILSNRAGHRLTYNDLSGVGGANSN